MNTNNLKLYDTLKSKLNLSDEKSSAIEQAFQDELHHTNKEIATKDFVRKEVVESKNELLKAIYLTSFIQILSIIGGIMAIIKFMQ